MSEKYDSDYMGYEIRQAAEKKFWAARYKLVGHQAKDMDEEQIRTGLNQAGDEYVTLGGRVINGRDWREVYAANQGAHMAPFCTTSGSGDGNLGVRVCVLPDGVGVSSAKNLTEMRYSLERLREREGKVEIGPMLDKIVAVYPPDELLYGLGGIDVGLTE